MYGPGIVGARQLFFKRKQGLTNSLYCYGRRIERSNRGWTVDTVSFPPSICPSIIYPFAHHHPSSIHQPNRYPANQPSSIHPPSSHPSIFPYIFPSMRLSTSPSILGGSYKNVPSRSLIIGSVLITCNMKLGWVNS